jgi:hypothetical protein
LFYKLGTQLKKNKNKNKNKLGPNGEMSKMLLGTSRLEGTSRVLNSVTYCSHASGKLKKT